MLFIPWTTKFQCPAMLIGERVRCRRGGLVVLVLIRQFALAWVEYYSYSNKYKYLEQSGRSGLNIGPEWSDSPESSVCL
ncbi:hypothetical protein GGR55DRAFT_630252, partial [Xylaria sp. FL0064]